MIEMKRNVLISHFDKKVEKVKLIRLIMYDTRDN